MRNQSARPQFVAVETGPILKRATRLLYNPGTLRFMISDFCPQSRDLRIGRIIRQKSRGNGSRIGEVGGLSGLVDVLKKRKERIESALGERIIFVVVATAAFCRETEESRSEGVL